MMDNFNRFDIGGSLEKYTFDYLLQVALDEVDDAYDKQQHGMISTLLSPCCKVLASVIEEVRYSYFDTFARYATGDLLDLRAEESGVHRLEATYCIKRAHILDNQGNVMSVTMGSRFASVGTADPIYYTVISEYAPDGEVIPGYYAVQCEQAGTAGMQYIGELVNVSSIKNFGTATIDTTIQPSRDAETDEEFRLRFLDTVASKSFGGNVAQYREMLMDIDGVGGVQVYPTWDGGGTVKVSVVDSEFNSISEDFQRDLQVRIDPENFDGDPGTGLGMAPIGHVVTVGTCSDVTVNITLTADFEQGYDSTTVEPHIVEKIEEYIESTRASWAYADSFNIHRVVIYISKVISSIGDTEGIVNIKDVMLNGQPDDLVLEQSSRTQQMPHLGEVVINEA